MAWLVAWLTLTVPLTVPTHFCYKTTVFQQQWSFLDTRMPLNRATNRANCATHRAIVPLTVPTVPLTVPTVPLTVPTVPLTVPTVPMVSIQLVPLPRPLIWLYQCSAS